MNERNLSEYENQIMNALLSVDFPGVEELREQLPTCIASDTGDTDNYGSIYLRPRIEKLAQTTSRVPVEAEYEDTDGGPVFVLLHVADGLLHEMEIYKADGGEIINQIDPSQLKVTVRK